MHWKGLNEWDMFEKRLLGAIDGPDPKEIEKASKAAADAFLILYGANGQKAADRKIPTAPLPANEEFSEVAATLRALDVSALRASVRFPPFQSSISLKLTPFARTDAALRDRRRCGANRCRSSHREQSSSAVARAAPGTVHQARRGSPSSSSVIASSSAWLQREAFARRPAYLGRPIRRPAPGPQQNGPGARS